MYVCTRSGGLVLPRYDEAGREVGKQTVERGQEVPGVEHWSYPNIIAHLNLDWIKWQGEATEAPHNAHKPFRVVDMRDYRGEKDPARPEPGSKAAKAHAKVVKAAQAQADTRTDCPDALCTECKRPFKNKAALTSHMRNKHPALLGAGQPQAG